MLCILLLSADIGTLWLTQISSTYDTIFSKSTTLAIAPTYLLSEG
jgi:hypothetical protein